MTKPDVRRRKTAAPAAVFLNYNRPEIKCKGGGSPLANIGQTF